jgi:hypothetical protein
MPYQPDLVEIFARNRLAVLQSGGVAAYEALLQEFRGDERFKAERARIEFLKAQVEAALEEQVSQQQQVQNAIRFLFGYRDIAWKRDLFHELIRIGYRPSWDSTRQTYFDNAWGKIKFDWDYFLSFTTRYPDVDGDNPINTAYRHFIVSEIGNDTFRSSDRKKVNLLASSVHKVLSESPIKGFYFPNYQYDNADTRTKLEEACDGCMVFVQLVQTIMFALPAQEGTNYCFEEWKRVRSRLNGPGDDGRILYVVVATDRTGFSNLIYPSDYADWHNHICGRDPPYLPDARNRSNATIEIRTTLKEKILAKIHGVRYHLIGDVP